MAHGIERDAFLEALRRRPYDRERFNCWHAAALIQSGLFGRALPLADAGLVNDPRARARLFRDHPARASWSRIEAPVDGALVLMGKVPGREDHCGVYLDELGGRVWHADAPHGLVDDTPLELAQSRRWRLAFFVPAV